MARGKPASPAVVAASSDPIGRRLTAVRLVIVAIVSGTILFSLPMWGGAEVFPRVPLVPGTPAWVGSVLLFAIAGSLVAAAASRTARLGMIGVCVVSVAFVVADLVRLQPFLFQSVVAFLLLSAAESRGASAERRAAIVDLLRLEQAALYLWAGLHKAQAGFVGHDFLFMLQPVFGWESLDKAPAIFTVLGWMAVVIETSIGPLLVVPRTRRLGIALSIGMHGFILVALGVLHRGYDLGVFPWNVGMVALTLVLFRGEAAPIAWRRVAAQPLIAAPFFIVAIALPALHGLDRWPANLSYALYTGNYSFGHTVITHARGNELVRAERGRGHLYAERPPELEALIARLPVERERLAQMGYVDLDRWVMEQYGQTIPPDGWMYVAIARRLCSGNDPWELAILVAPKTNVFGIGSPSALELYNCVARVY